MAPAQLAVGKRTKLVGKPFRRMEDPKFLTGNGRYVEDLRLAGMLHAAFLRSPHAHAKILRLDASRALRHPGVRAVLTWRDLEGRVEDMPTLEPEGETKGTVRKVLASDEVKYLGEAVAMVVADDRYAAQDALELVDADYEPLDVVVDAEAALRSDSPRVHQYLDDNIAKHIVHSSGDVDSAFRAADEVVEVELLNQLVAPVPMEARGLVAAYDGGNETLTVWLPCQSPHGTRKQLAAQLRMTQSRVRVIAPDIGGAFGAKVSLYPEDVAVSFAARRLGRPVKWVEERMENLLAMTHGRGQKQFAQLAVSRDGRILGLKVKIISDGGAYSAPDSVDTPELTLKMATGVYAIPSLQAEVFSVFTNKVPLGAYRGAGRPEASYLIERAVNVMAAKLKLDPVGVRRLNYISKERFPYETPGGFTYDSGDYQANLARALELSDYDSLKRRQREARAQGRLLGVGLVTWVEVCGFEPGFGQTAAVTVTEEGETIVAIGGEPHGQGHATPMAQVAAEELGLDLSQITVRHGDTDMLPWSSFTAGSRSAPLTGTAVLISARKVRTKMAKIAAQRLKVPWEGLVFEGGKIHPEGDPSRAVEFRKVARAAYDALKIPQGMEPTLFEYTAFAPPNNTFPFGTHVALVEVDRETGKVSVLEYFAVDDCGRLINPLVVEGQVHGGVAQGAGQALLEEVIYDENGQLLTSTMADYAVPSAETLPNIVWDRTETPTDANPLGAKGIGEAGTIAATPVLMNAIEDALSEYGVTVERMPARPDYIRSLITRGSSAATR